MTRSEFDANRALSTPVQPSPTWTRPAPVRGAARRAIRAQQIAHAIDAAFFVGLFAFGVWGFAS